MNRPSGRFPSPGCPRRPDAPTGRRRARFSLLPAFALVLATLGLFTAAPAQAQAPAAPTNLSVTPGDATLSVSWTAATGALSYDVHYTSAAAGTVANSAAGIIGSDPAAAWVAVNNIGAAAFHTISSLTNGTTYRVRVRARNSDGSSAWVFGSGTPLPTVTLSASPTSVPAGEAVTLTATLSSAQAGWITVSLGSQTGTAHSETYSLPSSIFIAGGQTTATSIITANLGVLQALGTFGVFISGFNKQPNVGNLINRTPSSAPLTITITGSENADLAALSATQAGSAGGPYSALDIGAFAAATTSYTATVPLATTHVKLRLRGEDQTSGYVVGSPSFPLASVQASLQDGTTVQKTSTSTLGIDLDFGPILLSVGENPITVRVTAQDGMTTKDYTVTVTLQQIPAPASLNVAPGNTQLALSWTAPSGTLSGYDVHYTSATTSNVANDAAVTTGAASAGWVAVSRSGTTASQTISSLDNDTDYRVRVRAVNASGAGAWAFGTGTPREAPTVSLLASETVSEGYSVQVIAELSEPASSDVDIRFTGTLGTGDTAAELEDFAAGSQALFASGKTLTIPAGEQNAEFYLDTEHDADGDDETFTVAIDTASLPAGYIAGSPTSAQVTIDDDETRNADPDGLTGLTVHDGTRELHFDANTAGDQVGLGGPDAIYTVQVNPGINSVTVTPTWTNTNITGVSGSVRYVTYGRAGATLTWGSGESETGKEVVLVAENLSAEGTTELTLTVTRLVDGETSMSDYRILFQHNFDWKNANDRLGGLKMKAYPSQ